LLNFSIEVDSIIHTLPAMSVATGSMLRAKESHSTSLDQNQDNKPASYAFFCG